MRSVIGKLWESMWRRRYLRRLRTELQRGTHRGSRREVLRQVEADARSTFRRRRPEVPDPQGLMVLSVSALALASYRELVRRGLAEEEAYGVVGRALNGVLATPTNWATQALMALLADPASRMRRLSLASIFSAIFGRMFDFGQEQTADGTVLTVNRCGFHDFFVQEGEPQLTRLMCAWDRNWLGLIDSSNRPIATRRSHTISTGAHRCEFHFDSAGSGPAPTVDVAIGRPPPHAVG